MGDLLGSLIWGAKSGQYCVIGGGSLHYVFGRGFTLPSQLIVVVKVSLDSFSQASISTTRSSSARNQALTIWEKPQEGRWKINWDAAIDKQTLKIGIGIVIRDFDGSVVVARAKFLPYIIDPPTAEAVAAWYAVSLGREVRGVSIILEDDSLEVVSALRKKDSGNRVFGHLLDDTKACFSHFSSVDVMHVRRNANNAARVLAKCVISQMLDMVWIEERPPFIHSVVLAK
jgi:hypothetical protein